MRTLFPALLALALAGAARSAGAEPLEIPVDQGELIHLEAPANQVAVSEPGIADVKVLGSRAVLVMAHALGRTDLVVLDRQGDELVNRTVEVVLEADMPTVNVIRGGRQGLSDTVLWCTPRCGTPSDQQEQGG